MLAFLVAAFAAIVAGVGVMIATLAAMWGLSRAPEELLGEATYGDFDFDHFEQPELMRFVGRSAVAFLLPTAAALVLIYVLHSTFIVPRASSWLTWLMFLLHYGAVYGLVKLLFDTPPRKTAVVAAVATVAYMFIYGVIIPQNMLF